MKKEMFFCTRNKKLVESTDKKGVANLCHCKISEILNMEELFAYLYCQCNLKVANDRNEYGSNTNMPTLSISPANYNKIKDCAVGDRIRIVCDDEPELTLTMSKNAAAGKHGQKKDNGKYRKPNRATNDVKYSGKELREQAIADGLIVPADSSSYNISRDNYSQGSEEEHKGWTPNRSEVRSYV